MPAGQNPSDSAATTVLEIGIPTCKVIYGNAGTYLTRLQVEVSAGSQILTRTKRTQLASLGSAMQVARFDAAHAGNVAVDTRFSVPSVTSRTSDW